MRIYLQNIPAKFHHDPIRNVGVLSPVQSTLSQKFGDCRTFAQKSATVSLFCDKLSHFSATVWTGF